MLAIATVGAVSSQYMEVEFVVLPKVALISSMSIVTAVMDDIVGWTAFHVRGECRPWSGFTAQVNCKLMKPIDVSSYLKVIGVVTNWQGRKVWVHAKLVSEDEEVHCTCEGLVILKKESADETGASS